MILFVSDMDGTLMDKSCTLTPETVEYLNRAIAAGAGFTVATARTPATVVDILAEVNTAIPAVLMCGAMIYDLKQEQIVKTFPMPQTLEEKVGEILAAEQLNGYFYVEKGDHLFVHYRADWETAAGKAFREVRMQKRQKTFVAETVPMGENCLFVCIIGGEVETGRVYEQIRKLDCMTVRYCDPYHQDVWYVEVYRAGISKAMGIGWLKERYQPEKILGFGDNHNDIPMTTACEESYAVAHGVPELKKRCTGVLEETDISAVGRFIERYQRDQR